jgi:hypothetical protein
VATDATNGAILGSLNGGTFYAKQGIGGAWVDEIDGVSAIALAAS